MIVACSAPLGAVLGPSWGNIGHYWGPLGAFLEASWSSLGALVLTVWDDAVFDLEVSAPPIHLQAQRLDLSDLWKNSKR